MTLLRLTAVELLAGFRARRFSPVEVLDAVTAAIAGHDAALGAFTTVRDVAAARAEAVAAERAYASAGADELPALLGVPFAVKDLFDTAGLRTTYGSALFADHVPERDAAAVAALRRDGAILVGKTQTHEVAWGLTSINAFAGTTANPWDPERISGGSSGGSAVAVAAGLVPVALGTDTAGSIRAPAALCGVVGLKPTYGAVSLDGVLPLARTLDHGGPITRHPADAALLLERLARPVATAIRLAPARPLEGLRVGVAAGGVPDQQRLVDAAAETLVQAGAVAPVSVAFEGERARAAFVAMQPAEALWAHRTAGLYPERAAEYGADVRARLEAAAEAGFDGYLRAQVERERLRDAMAATFAEVDVVLSTVAPAAPAREAMTQDDGAFRAQVMERTTLASLCGFPACVVRAGFDADGLPLAVQVMGAWGQEATVLAAAGRLVDATPEVQARVPALGAL